MVNQLVSDFIPPIEPISNIAPFSYKDGETYLSELARFRIFINNNLVGEVNRVANELIVEVANALVTQAATVDSALAEQTTEVDTAIANLTTYVNAQVAAIVDNSVTLNDGIAHTIFGNPASATRVETDALYASKATETTVSTGRLTDTNLQAEFALKSIETIVTTGRLTDANLQTEFALKSIETIVTTGRLTDANLQTEFALKSIETIVTTGRLADANLKTEFNPINLSGTYSARPAANSVPNGSLYIATDVPEMYLSNGVIWRVIGSGGNELASAAIAAPAGITTASTAAVDMPGATVSFVAGERPVEFSAFLNAANATVPNNTLVYLVLNGVTMYTAGGAYDTVAGKAHDISMSVRKAGLTPGNTYIAKLQMAVSGGTGTYGSQGILLEVCTL